MQEKSQQTEKRYPGRKPGFFLKSGGCLPKDQHPKQTGDSCTPQHRTRPPHFGSGLCIFGMYPSATSIGVYRAFHDRSPAADAGHFFGPLKRDVLELKRTRPKTRQRTGQCHLGGAVVAVEAFGPGHICGSKRRKSVL